MLNDKVFIGDQFSSVANRHKRAFIVKHLLNNKETDSTTFVKYSGTTLFLVKQDYGEKTIQSNSITDRYFTQSSKYLDQNQKFHTKTNSVIQSRLLISPCKLNNPQSFSFQKLQPTSIHQKKKEQQKIIRTNKTKTQTFLQSEQILPNKKKQLFIKNLPNIVNKLNKIRQSQGIEGFEQKGNEEWNDDFYDYLQRNKHY